MAYLCNLFTTLFGFFLREVGSSKKNTREACEFELSQIWGKWEHVLFFFFVRFWYSVSTMTQINYNDCTSAIASWFDNSLTIIFQRHPYFISFFDIMGFNIGWQFPITLHEVTNEFKDYENWECIPWLPNSFRGGGSIWKFPDTPNNGIFD